MLHVELCPDPRGQRFAVLRELCGRDEMTLDPEPSRTVAELLSRLLLPVPGAALGPESARSLSLSDRDRLVAQLHRHTFDDRIESHVVCAACERAFEFSFSLSSLVDQVEADAAEARARTSLIGPDDDGAYQLENGVRLRLPSVKDEEALQVLEPALHETELMRRCLVSTVETVETVETADALSLGESLAGARPSPPPAKAVSDETLVRIREEVETALEGLAPLLSRTLEPACAHCGALQEVQFDIVDYFVASLQREQTLLTREIHSLAMAYRWSFNEIMALPRHQRRAHVELVEVERGNLEPDDELF